MSRSGYTDDLDNWPLIQWRGRVASSIRGKRGQAMLRELLAALDAMPDKRLIDEELVNTEGEVCALGALGKARGIDMAQLDSEDYERVAQAFGVAEPLIQEIEYMNDEYNESRYDVTMTPEKRWQKMREWVASLIKPENAA